jgi:hypothetical protein
LVNAAAERLGSARSCASNPIRRATFQQVLLDAHVLPSRIQQRLFSVM